VALPDIDSRRIGIPIVDTCTGIQSCICVLVALLEPNHSRRGLQVEVTLYNPAIAILGPQTISTLNGGKANWISNRHASIVRYDNFRPRNALLFLAIDDERAIRLM
jgi:crotonobetainyl-CoA:carnitine CoA-transferase CaiB-like acyl-CoA transferase